MKELLKQLAAYNIWAHQKLGTAVLLLTEPQLQQELPSSFSSIHKTVLHTWDAESVWWQRVKLQERIMRPSENFNGNTPDAYAALLQQSRQWEEWVGAASENALLHVMAYYNSKKEHFKQPVYLILQHVFNHGTYHRGQIVNMLRQLGVQKIPETDFIIWTRKKS